MLTGHFFSCCSYNRYAAIAARATRRALKDSQRIQAEKREIVEIRAAKWVDGKRTF